MPRRPAGEIALTPAQRQARYRAARAAGLPPVRVVARRAADRRSRARRWADAVAELAALQASYRSWRAHLPLRLEATATALALDAVCALDLSALAAIAPPRGFGRD
jgi:hypothetical protein